MLAPKPQKRKSSSGGRAGNIGPEYQARVDAWLCVQILLENHIPAIWGLDHDDFFDLILTQTNEQTDDLFIKTSKGRDIFVNIKHTVKNSQREDSDLAKAFYQFIQQFLEKNLNNNDYRMVLITSPTSSEIIKSDLRNLLFKIRHSPSLDLELTPNNNSEKTILKTIIRHTTRDWKKLTGSSPSNEQIKEFLEQIWVKILDVDSSGIDERSAQAFLKSHILENASNAEKAWGSLVSFCLTLNSYSGGINLKKLQNELIRLGYYLKQTASYREDIENLKNYSGRVYKALHRFSVIAVGNKEIKIERLVKNALSSMLENQSVVVTGEPGSGKSGVLYDLVESLLEKNHDVIFLAVDRLDANNKISFRQELELNHDFTDILENWVGDKPKFLVIDALDASRDPEKSRFIYNLIEDCFQNNPSWRIVVSIRQFDLRYSHNLKKLFAGASDSEYNLPEFSNLSHINVPPLSDEEWLQIPEQYADFATLYLKANTELREMLRTIFNVKLIGELLGEGLAIDTISPIHTQIELLERYWQERVIDSDQKRDAREVILTRAVELMVKNRQLQVNRQELNAFTMDNVLTDLLHRNLLSEWNISEKMIESSVINFPHHVIYDYAVARLYLRGTKINLVEKLENDKELVLAIRPSIVLHFQYLIKMDEKIFWNQVFQVNKSSKVPSIGKLISASVTINSAKKVDFFVPLFDLLKRQDSVINSVAEKTLSFIINSLQVTSTYSIEQVIANNKLLWMDFLEILSKEFNSFIAHHIRVVLRSLLVEPKNLTRGQVNKLGLVSRRLLEFALSLPNYDPLLITDGITFVGKTIESNSEESEKVLRQIIAPEHVADYGHKELFIISQDIINIISYAPGLARDIYRVAFTVFDESNEKTSIGFSKIFNMTSTRRQDYEMARYSLNQKYSDFLTLSPINAIQVLIDVIDTFVESEHDRRYGFGSWNLIQESTSPQKRICEKFNFNGEEITLCSDRSQWWDNNRHSRDAEQLKMLEHFQHYFEKLCEDENNRKLIDDILNLVISRNQNAVFWRRLLRAGEKYPETFGKRLRSLGWTMPIILNQDTSNALGEYLKTNFIYFSSEDRKLTENAILSIPKSAKNNKQKKYLEYDRNRLLGCLPRNLISSKAKKLLEKLEQASKIPENQTDFGGGVEFMGQYTEEMIFKDSGINVEEQPNQLIKILYEPIKEFYEKFRNDSPGIGETKVIFDKLRALYEALSNDRSKQAEKLILDYAWGYLAGGAETAARTEGIVNEKEIFNLIKEILLVASDHPLPEPYENDEEHFNDHPSWGFPFVRGDAGRGLVWLANSQEGATPEVLDKIENLALSDSVIAVRYHVIIHINQLYYTSADLMWKVIEYVCSKENNRGIVDWFILGVLQRLVLHQPDRVFNLTKILYERFRQIPKAGEIRGKCAFVFILLAFNLKHLESWELLRKFIAQPYLYVSEVHQIIMSSGECLNLGLNASLNEKNEYIRLNSFKLLEQICRSAYDAFQNFIEEMNQKGDIKWTEEEIDKYKKLHNLIDFIITKLYFASGADSDRNANTEEKIPMDENARLQFFDESKKVLYAISETGFADVIHRLVETLRFFLPYNPKEVFLILVSAVKNGKKDGYQFESMAVSEIVAIVERILSADYKYILKENEECRMGMIEILDTFVEVGWASAQRLTYRLEDIFR